jgi:hypothetical protein
LKIVYCFLLRLAWIMILPFYASHHCWDDRYIIPLYPVFFSITMGSHKLLCPGWAGMAILLILATHISWDDSHMLPCSAMGWEGVSLTFLPWLI